MKLVTSNAHIIAKVDDRLNYAGKNSQDVRLTTKPYALRSIRTNGAVSPLPIRHLGVTRETFLVSQ